MQAMAQKQVIIALLLFLNVVLHVGSEWTFFHFQITKRKSVYAVLLI